MGKKNSSVISDTEEEKFSFRNGLVQRKTDLTYLWTKRLQILLMAIFGAALGAGLAWYWPVTYTSRLTFVVEESKGGGGSLLSGLAGQLGFDLGSIANSTGILGGDNVQELLKSRKMIKSTLLTPFRDSSALTLADKYAETSKLAEKWANKYNGGETVTFPANFKTYSRLQDSLIQVIIKRIIEKDLSVRKMDKKLTFFEVSATMRNEQVAQLFSLRLIEQATRFYIETKTKRQRINVNRLQTRADSIGRLLNKKTYAASAASSALLDINPAYTTANVNSEVQERDKRVLQTIYSEIIKNLEISRTMLMQETPTFQVVDEPELPLTKNKLGYIKSILSCSGITIFLFSMVLILRNKP
ncbi:MAG: hypothetical protein WBP45_06150 [Daejeonella sp.]